MIESGNIPCNLNAEQALLGAILCQNDCYWQVADFLKADDFINPFHRALYKSFSAIEKGEICSPVTLSPRFADHADLPDGMTSAACLAHLAAAAVSLIHSPEYGRIIHDLSQRRRLMILTEQGYHQAANLDRDGGARGVREEIETALHGLDGHESKTHDMEDMTGVVKKAMEQIDFAMKNDGRVVGVDTGLVKLNAATGGFRAGELWVVAGRPGMGKTALALNFARAAAEMGHDTGFFSLEMQSYELGQRLISDMARTDRQHVAYFHARKGGINQDEFNILARAGEQAGQLPLYISDAGGVTMAAVRIEAMRLKRRLERRGRRLQMIVIDYLQLMRAGDRYRGNKVQEVTEITASCKALAKELGLPVLLLSQLSRALESRENKRPMLADLRDSGSIEQDADGVIFCYREEYYLSRNEPKNPDKLAEWMARCEQLQHQMDIIIGKQRNGPLATVGVDFFKESSAVRDRCDHV